MPLTNRPESLTEQLLHILDGTLARMYELEEILNKEHSALRYLELDILDACNIDKISLFEVVEKNFNEATSIARELGYETGLPGLNKCLSSLAERDNKFHKYKQSLEETGLRCQRLNENNGQIIEAHASQTMQMISIIKNGGSNKELLYNSRGYSTSSNHGLSSLRTA